MSRPSSAGVRRSRAARGEQRSQLARHAEGRALIFSGETARGATLLDETLIALESGEVVYRGMCAIHRAEIVRLRGEWNGAAQEFCGHLIFAG